MLNTGKTKRSGTCGENLQWTLYEDGRLVISGTGAMNDYSKGNAPWYADRKSITALEIRDGVTTIGAWAFADLPELSKVVIADSIASSACVASNAFKESLDYVCDPRCYVSEALEKSLAASWDLHEPYSETLLYALYYTKRLDLFIQLLKEEGYQEPVYQKETLDYWSKEVYSPFVHAFYDENGVKRKKYTVTSKRLEDAYVFDESGAIVGYMATGAARNRPALEIMIDIRINQKFGKVVYYDLSVKDLTVSPRKK